MFSISTITIRSCEWSEIRRGWRFGAKDFLERLVETGATQNASLDHGLWFYGDFRAAEWLYYDITSPRAAGGRGFDPPRREGLRALAVPQGTPADGAVRYHPAES